MRCKIVRKNMHLSLIPNHVKRKIRRNSDMSNFLNKNKRFPLLYLLTNCRISKSKMVTVQCLSNSLFLIALKTFFYLITADKISFSFTGLDRKTRFWIYNKPHTIRLENIVLRKICFILKRYN